MNHAASEKQGFWARVRHAWVALDKQAFGCELVILLTLTLLALLPRLVRIGSAPPGLSGDELYNTIDALKLGPGDWQVYFEGNNGREALFLYLMAIPLNLFGREMWAVRLPAALLGTGSVLLAYAIGRQAFNRRVGLIGAALMAVSLWPVMHSRWGLRAVSLTFFTGLTVYLYGRARRRGKVIWWWIAAGIALGLTQYTYIPARVFPLVIIAWFAWLLVNNRAILRQSWRHLLLSFLIALIVFAPFGRYMLQNPDKVNQRIESVSGVNALNKALDGDPAALLKTISSVLLMFTISGDTAGRYHPEARPVFDPLTGFFFFIGLAACLWLAFRDDDKNRRADYALLLLWTGAMLAPNAILGSNTSFLRGAGAIVPIYLIAAIGLDRPYSWLFTRRPGQAALWRGGLAALIGVGLLLTLLNTWQIYFDVWARSAEVRGVYQASLADIGQYLEDHPPPEDVDLFISYNYVADAAPRAFAYYSDYQANWFNYNTTFGWRSGQGQAWYFVPYNKPLLEEALSRLAPGSQVETVFFDDGQPAFTLFRIEKDKLAWQPQHELNMSFVDGPQLIGLDLPDELVRGEAIPLTLHWQVSSGQQPLPNRLSYATVQLEDQQGNIWAQAEELIGFPEAGWQPGDRFTQRLILETPEGMPPGPVTLHFGLRDWTGPAFGVLPAADDGDQSAGPFLVRSRPAADPQVGTDIPVFDGILALEGQAFSTLLAPGLPLNISLDWLALEQPAVDYRVRLQLAEPGKDAYLSQIFDLWPEVYPPSQWQPGEQVATLHQLLVPLDIPTAADPELRIQVIGPEDEEPLPLSQGDDILATMSLSLREHHFEMPVIDHPLEALFSQEIQLLGYDLDDSDSRPNGEVRLTLYWKVLETPKAGYTVFNHLIGPDGEIQGQFDSPPVGDAWLTSTWLPGEIVVDRRTIPIRPGALPGNYQLAVGLYTAEDGQRLPVTVDGESLSDDRLFLTGLMIRES